MNLILIFLCALYKINAAPIEKIMIDMTHVYDENTINYPTLKKFEMTVVLNGTIGTSWYVPYCSFNYVFISKMAFYIY